MVVSEEGLSGEKLSALTSELNRLSGKYGVIQESPDGYLVSNDEGYAEICSSVKDRLATKHGGIGVFVGAGGLLSLLPDLPVDVVVMIDLDPSVLKFNETLAKLITKSSTPETVLHQLSLNEMPVRYRASSQLLDEADEYGEFHWTHPSRFPQVQHALRKKPIVYITADITNEGFGADFKCIAHTFNERIRFANLTNVHSYITPGTMDFLRSWVFEDDPTILYSSKKEVELGHFPRMFLVTNLQEYIQRAKTDVE